MTTFKKAKDRKLFLNNPPQKETHLKESKDGQNVDYKYKKGVFGSTNGAESTMKTYMKFSGLMSK